MVEDALRRESLGSLSSLHRNGPAMVPYTSNHAQRPFSTGGMQPDVSAFNLGAPQDSFLALTPQDIATLTNGQQSTIYQRSLPWTLDGASGPARQHAGLEQNVVDDLYKIIQGQNDMAAARNNLAAIQASQSSPLPFSTLTPDHASMYLAAAQQQNLSQGMFHRLIHPPSDATTNSLVEPALRHQDRCDMNYMRSSNQFPTPDLQALYASLPGAQPSSSLDLSFYTGALSGASGASNGGALGLAAPEKPPSKGVISKAQQPLRALSAYNFFFREERNRIVSECTGSYNCSDAKKKELLEAHWHRDRTQKRRHRKTHGKIAFTELSRVISQRWRELPEDTKAFYKMVAAEDLIRYHREMDELKGKTNSSEGSNFRA